MYHVSAQGVDERIINLHYYYYNIFKVSDLVVSVAPLKPTVSSSSTIHILSTAVFLAYSLKLLNM